jgi:uncharacterized lipoprotein YddW (UPF0748 family)
MKTTKFFPIIGGAFFILIFFFSAQAQARAVWVRPFVGADQTVRRDPARGREFIRRELEKIKRAGLNVVYLETFWDGYAIYPSGVVPQRPLAIAYGTAEDGKKSRDVLQIYLEEAAKLNLNIHAWMHVFHQWNSNLGGLEKSPIFSKNPDWAMLDASGSPLVKSEPEGANRDIYKTYLSPSNPSARKYLRAVVSELASKYPRLGGVQWDYIRYPLHTPEMQFDYSPDALARFKKETGIDARKISQRETPKEWEIWQNWKTRQITETVKELSEIVRKKRPGWEISAAVFPGFDENLRVKMQDSREWARKNYINALLPMLYSTDYEQVRSWSAEFKKGLPPKTKIYPALFIGHFYDPKQKKLDARYLDLTGKYEFSGFALFAAQSLTDDLIEKLNGKN